MFGLLSLVYSTEHNVFKVRHVVVGVRTSFLRLVGGYSIVWMDHIYVSIHLWMDTWGASTAANKAAVNDGEPLWLFGCLCYLVAVALEGLSEVV